MMKPMSNTTNESYWRNEADRCYHDGVILLKYDGSREATLEKLHGAVERDLKAILASQGKLGDFQKHHQLFRLAKDANVWKTLPEDLRDAVISTSNLHNATSYPAAHIAARPWYDDDSFKNLATGLVRLHQLLRDWKPEGDCDGGDSIE